MSHSQTDFRIIERTYKNDTKVYVLQEDRRHPYNWFDVKTFSELKTAKEFRDRLIGEQIRVERIVA